MAHLLNLGIQDVIKSHGLDSVADGIIEIQRQRFRDFILTIPLLPKTSKDVQRRWEQNSGRHGSKKQQAITATLNSKSSGSADTSRALSGGTQDATLKISALFDSAQSSQSDDKYRAPAELES
jgi:hypothetical protein